MVYAAQPREGTETVPMLVSAFSSPLRFMQLNPARGRKRLGVIINLLPKFLEVYAAQPREGTETRRWTRSTHPGRRYGLCSSTPRGDGNLPMICWQVSSFTPGLCSSTPRGDGNHLGHPLHEERDDHRVYAAQPREGTETLTYRAFSACCCRRGLCSSTPRGDGNTSSKFV